MTFKFPTVGRPSEAARAQAALYRSINRLTARRATLESAIAEAQAELGDVTSALAALQRAESDLLLPTEMFSTLLELNHEED